MSKLQDEVGSLLVRSFPSKKIYENYRPDWLNRLELDFYIPGLSLAIEVNGMQHYMFIPHFHKTYDMFEKRLADDEKKEAICESMGIAFYAITSIEEARDIVRDYTPKPESYYDKMPKQQAIIAKKIDKYFKKKLSNKQKLDALVARIILDFEIGIYKEITPEIGSYYLVYRRDVDRIIKTMR